MRAIEKRFCSLIYLKIQKCVPTQKKMKKKSWIFLFSIKKSVLSLHRYPENNLFTLKKTNTY